MLRAIYNSFTGDICGDVWDGGLTVMALKDARYGGLFGARASTTGYAPAMAGEMIPYGFYYLPTGGPGSTPLQIDYQGWAPMEMVRFAGMSVSCQISHPLYGAGEAIGLWTFEPLPGGLMSFRVREILHLDPYVKPQPVPPTQQIVYLNQSHFRQGTYIISQPGIYKLTEDISFNPFPVNNNRDAWTASRLRNNQLKSNGGAYDDFSFVLGFFAGIVVAADDVVIDLDGHRLEQSAEHALLQRFYANIELASAPFIFGQGPADFARSGFTPARRVTVRNGTLGRSSHHGIHGNLNTDVTVKDVVFEDWEVAAIGLNGVEGALFENLRATSRKDVPIIGTWSAARFLTPYLDYLETNVPWANLTVAGALRYVSAIKQELRDAMNNVYTDVMEQGYINSVSHPHEYDLFNNPNHLPDGNTYGFLLNKAGVAVNGFPSKPAGWSRPSRGVTMRNCRVFDVQCTPLEVAAVNVGNTAVIDPAGAVWRLRQTSNGQPVTITSFGPDAQYVGNVLADAQALVAKAKLHGLFPKSLDVRRSNMNQPIIDWIEATPGSPESWISSWLNPTKPWLCNGDDMFHVMKGAIGFKLDASVDTVVDRCVVESLANTGLPADDVCGDYSQSQSHPLATTLGYGGADTRGFSAAGSENLYIHNSIAHNLHSNHGNVYGVDIFTDSSRVEAIDVDISGVVQGQGKQGIAYHLGPHTMENLVRRYCSDHVPRPVLDDGMDNDLAKEGRCAQMEDMAAPMDMMAMMGL